MRESGFYPDCFDPYLRYGITTNFEKLCVCGVECKRLERSTTSQDAELASAVWSCV